MLTAFVVLYLGIWTWVPRADLFEVLWLAGILASAIMVLVTRGRKSWKTGRADQIVTAAAVVVIALALVGIVRPGLADDDFCNPCYGMRGMLGNQTSEMEAFDRIKEDFAALEPKDLSVSLDSSREFTLLLSDLASCERARDRSRELDYVRAVSSCQVYIGSRTGYR